MPDAPASTGGDVKPALLQVKFSNTLETSVVSESFPPKTSVFQAIIKIKQPSLEDLTTPIGLPPGQTQHVTPLDRQRAQVPRALARPSWIKVFMFYEARSTASLGRNLLHSFRV
jgi:hypothetical protein